jgi:hypothetical protein
MEFRGREFLKWQLRLHETFVLLGRGLSYLEGVKKLTDVHIQLLLRMR